VEEIKMNLVFFSIGSNEGDRLYNISKSILLLNKYIGETIAISSIYENPPFGFEADLNFYNLCLSIRTDEPPESILFHIKNIEKEIGRKTKSVNGVYSSRCIDIDILFYENYLIDTGELSIPHIQLYFRRFVLEPLFEIAREFIDPKTGLTISVLLDRCEDKSQLIKLPIYKEFK
jgi:2-amino-4-hydroxy-6-hydroxymethyldihydropteridine diphosphokinase